MSILTEKLPQSIEVNNENYEINTDFRLWIQFSQAVFSTENEYSRLAMAMCTIFKKLPVNLADALSAMMDFYTMRKKSYNEKVQDNKKVQIFDFDHDAELIFAAFMQQYHIDLTQEKMHWWVFKALLDSLAEDTHFVKVLQYRGKDLSKIKDKELKQFYAKMRKQYELPDKRSETEKERDFAQGMKAMI